MKKTIISLAAIVFSCMLVAVLDSASLSQRVSAQKVRNTDQAETKANADSDSKFAALIRKLTDGGPESKRRETQLPGGGALTDLAGAHQNVMLARMDESGDPIAACVTDLGEANRFFGRDLETGEKVPHTDFDRESTAVIAARHGMSEQEYLFFSKLASEEFVREALSRPQSATINIVNGDGAGEGFNDPAVRAPEGGNTGVTLGQQRLNLFNHAASIWGGFLDSAATTNVNAQFNVLMPCSSGGGVLGSAGTAFTARDFANAQFANTDYHIALANKLAGSDLTGGLSLINATFNTNIDNACLGAGTRFYYGLNNSTPPSTVNLLVVLLHELGHGLGFSSFATTITLSAATNASPIVATSNGHGLANGDTVTVQNAAGNTAANGTWTVANRTTNTFELAGSTGNGAYSVNTGIIRGVYRNGRPDIWSRFMFDRSTSKYWNVMTTAERAASSINTNNLMWDGVNVKIGSGTQTAGREAATGRLEMFTPNPFQQGSSVSHFNTLAAPNLLMEPSINAGLPLDLDLTRQLFRDIGWYRDTTSDLTADTITGITPNGGGAVIGAVVPITWTNGGSFNRNVKIELSTDGGATFPTVIAANAANTGTFAWTVPNIPTSTARIRVREADFAAPSGSSSANFTISSSPLAGGAALSGRVLDQNGRAISRATVVLNDSSGTTLTAVSNPFGYFTFDDLPVGETYVVNVRHKRYRFEAQVINLTDSFAGLVFMASE